MRIQPLSLFIGLGLSLLNSLSHAALLNARELPNSIETCLQTSSCAVDNQSAYDTQALSAFRYQNGSFSGYLVRYELKSPSAAFDSSYRVDLNLDPPSINQQSSTSPLSGNVWLQVAEHYSTQNSMHGITLYLEQVQPSHLATLPRLFLPDTTKTFNFRLTDTAIEASQAYKSLYLNEFDTSERGDLAAEEMLLVCVANGCGIEQQLNLVGMHFSRVGDQWVTQFVEDKRALLYSERMYYNSIEQGNNNLRSFYVQPVPIMPSAGLFVSGLLALYASRRKHAG